MENGSFVIRAYDDNRHMLYLAFKRVGPESERVLDYWTRKIVRAERYETAEKADEVRKSIRWRKTFTINLDKRRG